MQEENKKKKIGVVLIILTIIILPFFIIYWLGITILAINSYFNSLKSAIEDEVNKI